MYNSYREIVFLLNLLLKNDKKVELSEADIFTREGGFRPAAEGQRSGEEILGGVASAYVSFMRGENPLAFPIRLPPQGVPALTAWPPMTLDAKVIAEEVRERMLKLPFVPLSYEGDSLAEYTRLTQEIVLNSGIGINSIDEMVQAGNWLFPTVGGGRQSRDTGFDSCFATTGGSLPFKLQGEDPSWLLTANLGQTSVKAKIILERAATARGPVFVYSRFIKSGALPLALALEANGYLPWGRRPMLENGAVDGLGGQCALCSKRATTHSGADHKFTQAHYILITGRSSISPKNAEDIQAARAEANKRGAQIKVVLGSQVASEGVDFRFIREIYVFDSWFHLNKMEQVLGRGVRFCSHSLLKPEERNCTIHLLVNNIEGDTETADLYMYREAMAKAIQVGRVTRVLKQYALDCNLNRDAVQITGLATQRHIDSQRVDREEVNVNDMPFTNVCDWIETCEYKCAKVVEEADMGTDMSTYTEYAVRWRESRLRSAIRSLFGRREQPVFQLADILDMMSAVPPRAVQGLLAEIVGNQAFRVRLRNKEGYIIYRNGYYMFQPDYLADVRAPLALRVADVPVKRDAFEPTSIRLQAAAAAPAPAAAAADGTTEAPAPAAAQATESIVQFWKAIIQWATEIAAGAAMKENIPPYCCTAIQAAFSGDERIRERERLIMINWLYEHIVTTAEYSEEQKREYLFSLSNILLEFVWDETLKVTEQQALVTVEEETTRKVAREQLLKRGEQTVFRWVDATTGVIRYMCGDKECFAAVTQGLERDDPMRQMKADQTTTGRNYGFIVPKAKEGRLVFKTNDVPVAPGKSPEKGRECTIVSAISYHITELKAMGEMLAREGFPKFILTEEVLDEKTRRLKERADAKAAGRATQARADIKVCGSSEPNARSTRSFENSTRACALKNIILRWLDDMNQRRGAGRLRYFYRPIASIKTGHRGAVAKA
jgi:hypothetical protein